MAGIYDLMQSATPAIPQPRRLKRQPREYLPEDQKQDMLRSMAQTAGGAIGTLGTVLDTPAAILRGALVGKPLSGFSTSDENRVGGRELLDYYGVIDKNTNPYAAGLASFATEVALDPLAMVSGPLNALTKGGKAVKAAGLMGRASEAAVARMGKKAAMDTFTGRGTRRFLRNVLPRKKALNPENYKYRPMVGPRLAQNTATVRDVVERTGGSAEEIAKRVAAIDNYLKPRGSSYAQAADDKLGGAFGLGYFSPVITFGTTNKQVLNTLDYLDSLGQAARWSAPARALSRVFNRKVAGTYSAGDQLAAMKQFDQVKAERSMARQQAARHIDLARSIPVSKNARDILGADSLLSKEANNYLTRVFENVQTNADEQLTNLLGRDKINQLAESWRSLSTLQVDKAKSLGIDVRAFHDPRYNVFYSPRNALEADFGEYGKGMSRAAASVKTIEGEARQKYLQTPGGTVDLREISLLPIVQRFIAEKDEAIKEKNIEAVGRAIKEFLDKKHGASAKGTPGFRSQPFNTYISRLEEQVLPAKPMNPVAQQLPVLASVFKPDEVIQQSTAERIARFMGRMSKDLPPGTPMFSQHPLAAQTKNLISQATARANAKFVIDSIAEAALRGRANAQRGRGMYQTLDTAIERIGKKIGATYSGAAAEKKGSVTSEFFQQIKEKIAAEYGVSPDKVDLSKFSLPEDVMNRLVRIQDFYSSPRAQQAALEFFNQYTQLYKGFLLAFPSRHVRDMYSNAFSVWLEVGDPVTTNWGFYAAQKVMAGKYDEAASMLSKIPGYPTDTNAVRKKLFDDVSGSGILDTLASSDVMTSNQSGTLNQLAPGSTPVGKYDFMKEFFPSKDTYTSGADLFQFKGIRLPGQAAKAAETRNPLLNASQKFSDYTDSVARLGGFLAMMKKGASPQYAAERITEVLVDYSSLTPIERNLFRSIFPWYAYNSRIGAAVAKQIMRNPGGAYAQTVRGMNTLQETDQDTYIPEALRQQFAIRVPDQVKEYLGIEPTPGVTTFLKDIDLPAMDVISLFDPQPTAYGTVSGTMQNLGNQMTPALRTIAEFGTDTDFFSRRPLREATRPLDRIYKRVFKTTKNLDPVTRALIEMIPGPRIAGPIGGMLDDRIPDVRQRGLKQAVNALTGVKLTDVDAEWQLQDARRNAVQKLGGLTTNYTQLYIPKERMPEVPPELMPFYNLYRELGRDLREARKAKNK